MSPDQAHDLYRQELAVLEAEGQTGSATRDVNSLFYGRPHDDYVRALRSVRDEVEERAYLAIVAATEGVLQTDFRARKRAKAKAKLRSSAKALLKREKMKGRRVELEEILDAWCDEPGVPSGVIGEFKQLVAHRHWLAHGRYFIDKAGVPADPGFAYARARALITQLQAIDAAFPRS
jgi:hypothetical protein